MEPTNVVVQVGFLEALLERGPITLPQFDREYGISLEERGEDKDNKALNVVTLPKDAEETLLRTIVDTAEENVKAQLVSEPLAKFRWAAKKILWRIRQRAKALQMIQRSGSTEVGATASLREFGSNGTVVNPATVSIDDMFDIYSRELGYHRCKLLGSNPELWVYFPRLRKREKILTSVYLQSTLNRSVLASKERKSRSVRKVLSDLLEIGGEALCLGIWQYCSGPDFSLQHIVFESGILYRLIELAKSNTSGEIAVGALWILCEKAPSLIDVLVEHFDLVRQAIEYFPDSRNLVGLLASISTSPLGNTQLCGERSVLRILQILSLQGLEKESSTQLISILASLWPKSLLALTSIFKSNDGTKKEAKNDAKESNMELSPKEAGEMTSLEADPVAVISVLVQIVQDFIEESRQTKGKDPGCTLACIPAICVLSQIGQAHPENNWYTELSVLNTFVTIGLNGYVAWCNVRRHGDRKSIGYLDVLLQSCSCGIVQWIRGQDGLDQIQNPDTVAKILRFLTNVFATHEKRNQITAVHALLELFETLNPIPESVSQLVLSRLRLSHAIPEITRAILSRSFNSSEACLAMNGQGALVVVLNMMRHHIKERSSLFLASKAALLLALSPNVHSFSVSLLLSLLQSSEGDARNSLLCVLYGVAVGEDAFSDSVLRDLVSTESSYDLMIRVLASVSLDFFKPFFEIVCLVFWRMIERFEGKDVALDVYSNTMLAHLLGNCSHLRQNISRYLDYSTSSHVPTNHLLNVYFEKEVQMWCAVSFKRSILETGKSLPGTLRGASYIIGFYETQRAAVHAIVEYEREKEFQRNKFLDPIKSSSEKEDKGVAVDEHGTSLSKVDPFQMERIGLVISCRVRILLSMLTDMLRLSKERLVKQHRTEVIELGKKFRDQREKRKELQEKEETCLELDEIPESRVRFRKLEKLQRISDTQELKSLLKNQQEETCIVQQVLFSKEVIGELFFVGLCDRFDPETKQIAAWLLWELLFEQTYVRKTKISQHEVARAKMSFRKSRNKPTLLRQRTRSRQMSDSSTQDPATSFRSESGQTSSPPETPGSPMSPMSILRQESFGTFGRAYTEQAEEIDPEYFADKVYSDEEVSDLEDGEDEDGEFESGNNDIWGADEDSEEEEETSESKDQLTEVFESTQPISDSNDETLSESWAKKTWLFGRQSSFYTIRFSCLLTKLASSKHPDLEHSSSRLFARFARITDSKNLKACSPIAKTDGIPALLLMLKNPNPSVQFYSALALRQMTTSTVHQEIMSANGGFNRLLKLAMDDTLLEKTRSMIQEILVPLRRNPCNGSRLYQAEMQGISSEYIQRPLKKVTFTPAVQNIHISTTPRTKGAYKVQLKPLLFSELYPETEELERKSQLPQSVQKLHDFQPRSIKRTTSQNCIGGEKEKEGPTFVFYPGSQRRNRLKFSKYLSEDPKLSDEFWEKSLSKFDKLGNHVLCDAPTFQAPDGQRFHLFLKAAVPQEPVLPERARIFETALRGLLRPLSIENVCELRNFQRLPGESLSSLLLRFSQITVETSGSHEADEESGLITSSVRLSHALINVGGPKLHKRCHPLLEYLGRKLGRVIDQAEDFPHFYFVSANHEEMAAFEKHRNDRRHRATTMIGTDLNLLLQTGDTKEPSEPVLSQAQLAIISCFQSKNGQVNWRSEEADQACINSDLDSGVFKFLKDWERGKVLEVLRKNASLLLGLFRFYSSDHTARDNLTEVRFEPFTLQMMKLPRFLKLLKDAGITAKSNRLTKERYELAFLSTIGTNSCRDAQHPLNEKFTGNQCYSFNKHMHAVFRDEFGACLVRVACIKYPELDAASATETLFQDDFEAFLYESLLDVNVFRILRFQNESVFDMVFKYANDLKGVFDKYSGSHPQTKMWGGMQKLRMSMPDWFNFLNELPSFSVSDQVGQKAFALSLDSQVDPVGQWEKAVTLNFPSFILALGRLADMTFWPNEDIRSEVSAASIVEFFEFMHDSAFFHMNYDEFLRPFLGTSHLSILKLCRPKKYEYAFLERYQYGIDLSTKMNYLMDIIFHKPLQLPETSSGNKAKKKGPKRNAKYQASLEWLHQAGPSFVKALSFKLSSDSQITLPNVVMAQKAYSLCKRWALTHSLDATLQIFDQLILEFDEALRQTLLMAKEMISEHMASSSI